MYFLLFVKLLNFGEREQAIQVLKSNFRLIPLDEVTKYLKDEEIYDPSLNQVYQRAFIEMGRVAKELQLLYGLTKA